MYGYEKEKKKERKNPNPKNNKPKASTKIDPELTSYLAGSVLLSHVSTFL